MSANELCVANLLMQGMTKREISERMNKSVRTVKEYMAGLFILFAIKDGCKRVKLIRALHQAGIASLHEKPQLQL